MVIEPFINREFTPLAPDDSVATAIARMDAWRSETLPVVEPTTGKVIGQIKLEQLVEVEQESSPVSGLELTPAVTLHARQHVFEATRTLLMHEVRFITVVDREEKCLGILEKEKMMEVLTGYLNVTVQGSEITVEMDTKDYTLAEIVHLIESENARILGIAVEAPANQADPFLVSCKLNVRDSSAISQSLRRHGYTVRSESRSDLLHVDMADRADELMRYLDV